MPAVHSLAIIACIQVIIQVCVGIDVFLVVFLKVTIEILVGLCGTLLVNVSLVTKLNALLIL